MWKTEQLKPTFLCTQEEKGFKQHFSLYPQAVGAKNKRR